MIGTSLWDYYFIRACILFLHHIAPLSAIYFVAIIFLHPAGYRVPLLLEIWAIAETLFLLLIYYPRNFLLQRAASHPEPLSREKRRELFHRCQDSIHDPERYISLWHRGAPPSDVKRDNIKEFLCWAFLNKADHGPEDEEELEEYLQKTELLLGRKLEPGRGNAIPLRISVDEVKTLYRSLFWYLCVSVVDSITYVRLRLGGFRFHRLAISRFFAVFPLRPFTLLSREKTPVKTLTYWHRPHTSKSRLPVLFVHGIGIGLYPYVNFLNQINQPQSHSDDGEIGIIAVEIMPVSFRITGAALEKEKLCDEILQILHQQGWERFVLVSHSYGSVISSHLLHNPETSKMVGPIFLIDPVSILLHLPDVAYNFTCRPPQRANEQQLWYFATMDQGVAHTLGRCFFWSEIILWKEDIEGHQVTVSLSGKDLIVDSEAVGRYLTKGVDMPTSEEWKCLEWEGKGLDILWFEELDHAQVFDSRRSCEILVNVIREYSLVKTRPQSNGRIP